jgi:hypothetical protein
MKTSMGVRRAGEGAALPPVLARRWAIAACACFGLAGCYAFTPDSETLSCDDVLPAGEADFGDIVALVDDNQKGCTAAPCHSAESQTEGFRLDTSELVYDELSTRPEVFYSILAAGEMPEGGTRWSENDLALLRSWYCDGAFPP